VSWQALTVCRLCAPQVGIPENVATVLTFPERVTDHNIEALRRAVCNGAPPRHGHAWGRMSQLRTRSGCLEEKPDLHVVAREGSHAQREAREGGCWGKQPHAPGGPPNDAAMRLRGRAGGRAGVAAWPGANFLEYARGGGRFSLKWGDRRRLAAELKARPLKVAVMGEAHALHVTHASARHAVGVGAYVRSFPPPVSCTCSYKKCIR